MRRLFFVSGLFFSLFIPSAALSVGEVPAGCYTPLTLSANATTVLVGGLAWNSTAGWISQRGSVTAAGGGSSGENYGVEKIETGTPDEKDQFIGSSWSDVYGWVCWGKTCRTVSCFGSKVPPGGGGDETKSVAKMDSASCFNKVVELPWQVRAVRKVCPLNGWLKVLTLRDNGWIRLSGDIQASDVVDRSSLSPRTVSCLALREKRTRAEQLSDQEQKDFITLCSYGVVYDEINREFSGWAWSDKLGWIAFSGRTLYETPFVYTNTQGQEVVGAACGDTATCASVSYENNASRWLTQYLGSWFQTKGGNIYAKEGFGGTGIPPAGGASSFLSLTGSYEESGSVGGSGTSAITSKSLGQKGKDEHKRKRRTTRDGKKREEVEVDGQTKERVIGPIGQWSGQCEGSDSCGSFGILLEDTTKSKEGIFLEDITKKLIIGLPRRFTRTQKKEGDSTQEEEVVFLRSNFGSLNADALTSFPPQGAKRNRYGYEVVRITDGAALLTALGSNSQGGGRTGIVYLKDGDFTVSGGRNDEWIITNGGPGYSGARTVVVKGNITFSSRLVYEAAQVSSLKQLASVAWVALKRKDASGNIIENSGNIIIGNCVKPKVISSQLIVPLAGTFYAEGKITTGTGGTSEAPCSEFSSGPAPLRINGKLIADKVEFQRSYRGFDRASEAIWDDGRLVVNTPPGMERLAHSLPSW